MSDINRIEQRALALLVTTGVRSSETIAEVLGCEPDVVRVALRNSTQAVWDVGRESPGGPQVQGWRLTRP